MNTNTKNVHVSKEQTSERSGKLYRASGHLLICKKTSRTVPHNFVNTTRNRIVGFSAGSATRMRRYLRECLPVYTNMVTLTYPGFYESNGAVSKDHLRRFLQETRRYLERHGLLVVRYSTFWFLEFQERGAPHYHLFTTASIPKDIVAKIWYRIVNSEDPRHLAAGTRIEKLKTGKGGLISYANKYAAKQCQKIVPAGYENVGRFWGVSGDRATLSADTFVSREDDEVQSVRVVQKLLFSQVWEAINMGEAEVYKRESGVLVAIIHNHHCMRKIRMRISQIAALTQKVPQTFQDAEIEIGEGLWI